MTSVAASGASMRSIVVNTVFTRVLTFGSHVRSRLHLASAALKGSPLCHLTPGRILNDQVVGAVSFHSVARPGWSLPSGCRAVRLSKMLKEMRMSLEDVLKWGSNFEMSPPWATTSSRFWVVWARAGWAAGRAPATPRAAAPFSRSRRAIWTIEPPSGIVLGRTRRRCPRTQGARRAVAALYPACGRCQERTGRGRGSLASRATGRR